MRGFTAVSTMVALVAASLWSRSGVAAVPFSEVRDKLVFVNCENSTGSGFVLAMEAGRRYFITNRHVIEGEGTVKAVMMNGKALVFSGFEVARNRDLVRFEVTPETPAFTLSAEKPNVGDAVSVFGNSSGAGVATSIGGSVLGVGPDRIEVSAAFVQGNSGSPVVNARGEVVGVATYATYENNPENWVKRDTRFSEVRRYAVTFDHVEWKRIGYSDFLAECRRLRQKKEAELGIVPQATAKFYAPKMSVVQRTGSAARSYVTGQIVLSLGGFSGQIKNPLVRVVAVLRSESGELFVKDCILNTPWKMKTCFDGRSLPVYSYGMKSDGFGFEIGNGLFAYYLEGMSYHQRELFLPKDRMKTARRIEYFEPLKENVLFELPRNVRKWTLIAYRLECWQNGSLACYHNSKPAEALRSRDIPADWFIIDKYPEKFNYRLSRFD